MHSLHFLPIHAIVRIRGNWLNLILRDSSVAIVVVVLSFFRYRTVTDIYEHEEKVDLKTGDYTKKRVRDYGPR